MENPITWVTMSMILIVLVVACICVPKTSEDKPILAYEDIIYKDFRDEHAQNHQQWHELRQIDRWYQKIERMKQEIRLTEIELSMTMHSDAGSNGSNGRDGRDARRPGLDTNGVDSESVTKDNTFTLDSITSMRSANGLSRKGTTRGVVRRKNGKYCKLRDDMWCFGVIVFKMIGLEIDVK